MIISCPNCTTRFNLDAELLGETGRNVKCAKCAHRWFATPAAGNAVAASPPPSPAAAPVAPRPVAPEPEDKSQDREDEERPADSPPSPLPIPSEEDIARFQLRPTTTKSTIIWWVVLFAVIVALVTGTVFFRRDIAALYPPSNRLFLAIGLPTDTLGYGLKIHDPKMSQRSEGENRILVITGEIENETGDVIDVPLLRGAVKNARGRELFVWSFKTKEPRVLAGEKNPYETEVRNPPPGASQPSITFTRESEMLAEKKRAMKATAKPKK